MNTVAAADGRGQNHRRLPVGQDTAVERPEPVVNEQTPGGPPHTVAAIDVGSHAIRMEVAEVAPDGRIRVIEVLQRAVPDTS